MPHCNASLSFIATATRVYTLTQMHLGVHVHRRAAYILGVCICTMRVHLIFVESTQKGTSNWKLCTYDAVSHFLKWNYSLRNRRNGTIWRWLRSRVESRMHLVTSSNSTPRSKPSSWAQDAPIHTRVSPATLGAFYVDTIVWFFRFIYSVSFTALCGGILHVSCVVYEYSRTSTLWNVTNAHMYFAGTLKFDGYLTICCAKKMRYMLMFGCNCALLQLIWRVSRPPTPTGRRSCASTRC